jgi:hypothetical protein
MVHATLQSNGVNRQIVVSVDPAVNPEQAAEIALMFASVVEAYGYEGTAHNLRQFADNAAELAKPDPVGESGT